VKTKLVITADGDDFVGVYNDRIQPLTEALGMQVSRVSDVVYDHDKKEWQAFRKDGKLLASSKNRKECVEKEVEELEKSLPELFGIE